jgi:hypothetical protein
LSLFRHLESILRQITLLIASTGGGRQLSILPEKPPKIRSLMTEIPQANNITCMGRKIGPSPIGVQRMVEKITIVWGLQICDKLKRSMSATEVWQCCSIGGESAHSKFVYDYLHKIQTRRHSLSEKSRLGVAIKSKQHRPCRTPCLIWSGTGLVPLGVHLSHLTSN